MSELNSDQLVINEGRKNALSGVEAPLRDRIVKALYDKLADEEGLNIPARVANIWTTGTKNRAIWNERQLAWLNSWDQYLIGDNSGDYEGSSNLHVPMPFMVCKTFHARMLQAIWQDPPFNCKANNQAALERVPVVRDTLRYYLMRGANYNKGVAQVVDSWIWDWCTLGSSIMKLRWDVQYSRFRDVRNVPKVKRQIVLAPDGSEQAVDVPYEEEEEFDAVKRCFDGPVFDLVDLEDILIVGGGGDPDLADAVLQRQYLTASELWTLSDRKIFNADAVEAVVGGGPDRLSGAVGNDAKEERSRNAGKGSLDSEEDLDRYEIIEAYLRVDVDGSGINSDIVAWVHTKSRKLLRATYLYRISKSGERPFIKADFQPRKGQEFGVGLVEMLYPLSVEMDFHHNSRIDFGLLSTMPFGFYRPSSGIDPQTIRYEPGALIPVDNPATDVFFPNLGNRTSFGFQEEAALQQMVERLTSVSDLNLGVLGGQGATRTATGARALMSESSGNLDVYLRRLNYGWSKALRVLLHTLQQRIPKGLSFRVTGDDGADYWRVVRSADDIEGDYDIEVSPNSSSSNSGMQQELASQVFGLVSNPLLIQTGTVTPGNLYEAAKNLLQAWGAKDWAKFIQKPMGYEYIPTPLEELNRVFAGMKAPILPNSDHQGFIALWEEFKANDELLGQVNEEQTQMAERQAQAHAQMMQALSEAQAQAANAGQMQRNAAMSQQQAPTGMNPAAGSMGPPPGAPA